MPIKYDSELKKAVLAYLSECDNPVPDYNYRRTLRNRLRELTGAPAEPGTRSVATSRPIRRDGHQ